MKLRTNVIRAVIYSAAILLPMWFFGLHRQRIYLQHSLNRRQEKQWIISKLTKISENFRGKIPTEMSHQVEQLKQELASRHEFPELRDASEETCGNGLGLVKDEYYRGNLDTQKYWYEGAWPLNETSPSTESLENLITIVTVLKSDSPTEFISKLCANLKSSRYSHVQIIVGVLSDSHFEHRTNCENVDVVVSSGSTESELWLRILRHVDTRFVLVGRNINQLYPKWMNIERSIRLLNGHPDTVHAIGGATRNLTGHWRMNCYQANILYFNLILQPGYESSVCDCMVCPAIWKSGPFVARTNDLIDLLQPSLSSDLMFLDWFVAKRLRGSSALACPDILYMVNDNSAQDISRENWKEFAKLRKFGSVEIMDDYRPRSQSFSCEEVGLTCDPMSQADSQLVPWCCSLYYNYVIKTIDELSTRLGFHYELDSGSLLGAVKLNNFIPWDIDGDIYIPTEQIHLFDAGAVGAKELEKAGIQVFGHKTDNYWDVGAGYFRLFYKGVDFEMLGKRGNLTTYMLPDAVTTTVTRILVGNTWAKVHTHPGEYLRGRYGPGYLKHVQAWRFLDSMDTAFDYGKTAAVGGWKPCPNFGDHSCLDRYPEDGNLNLIPQRYP